MARAFVNADSEGLFVDTAAVNSHPLTMACWFYSLNVTAYSSILSLVDKDVGSRRVTLLPAGAVAGDPLRLYAQYSGVGSLDTTTGFSANTWHHACGVLASSTSRAVYLDGGGKVTDATSLGTLSELDRTAVGYLADSTPDTYHDGRIAEVGFWNVALTDEEVAALAAGASPLLVRPESLVTYLPLIRDNDTDLMGGVGTLSEVGTPTIGDHPPGIIYPSQQEIWTPGGAAPPATRNRAMVCS